MTETWTDPRVPETNASASPQGPVLVRYWAAARAAAGRAEDRVESAATVQQVLDDIAARRPGDDRFARVLAISSLLLGERPLGNDALDQVPVAPGDVIEVLPPFAGG